MQEWSTGLKVGMSILLLCTIISAIIFTSTVAQTFGQREFEGQAQSIKAAQNDFDTSTFLGKTILLDSLLTELYSYASNTSDIVRFQVTIDSTQYEADLYHPDNLDAALNDYRYNALVTVNSIVTSSGTTYIRGETKIGG